MATEKASVNGRILVVEDEPQVRAAVCRLLRRTDLQVVEADTCDAAMRAMETEPVDFVLTDVHLPDGKGFSILDAAANLERQPGMLVMTGDESVSTAVSALQCRAADYLVKPFSFDALAAALERAKPAVAKPAAPSAEDRKAPLEAWRAKYAPSMLGSDPKMMRVFDVIRRVCDTDCSVLINGESGTGKELVARALHDASGRARQPFVTVNCAAIPENLLESELFGHVRGAFTGATNARIGRFAAADGGTLFLDEIGELPLPLQAKLLRAVQTKEITPVGETRARRVDVRVVAATHRDLEAMVDAGTFREDLFYRIQVVPIELPALRERRGDIAQLVEHFVREINRKRDRGITGVTGDALRSLCAYDWPGNVRQLENMLERMVLLRDDGHIGMEDLPAKLRGSEVGVESEEPMTLPEDGIDLRDAVERFENTLILQALERTGWNKNRAAAVLRMNRTTLVEKLKKKNLDSAPERNCA